MFSVLYSFLVLAIFFSFNTYIEFVISLQSFIGSYCFLCFLSELEMMTWFVLTVLFR